LFYRAICGTGIKRESLFLDEAGYACIVKALTLFRNNIPITFLGDHMQLPPVCLLNDEDFNTNTDYRDVFIWSQSAIYSETLFSRTRETALKDYLIKSNQLSLRQLDVICEQRTVLE
jgi:hypothetical protein